MSLTLSTDSDARRGTLPYATLLGSLTTPSLNSLTLNDIELDMIPEIIALRQRCYFRLSELWLKLPFKVAKTDDDPPPVMDLFAICTNLISLHIEDDEAILDYVTVLHTISESKGQDDLSNCLLPKLQRLEIFGSDPSENWAFLVTATST